MKTVKIQVAKLQEILEENKLNHVAIFEKAVEGYRKQAIAELEKSLEEARNGLRIRRTIALIEPMNQTKEYDRILKQLSLTSDRIVELTDSEFANYVMDDWSWKDQFLVSSSAYI